jgi:hypothetical protein
MENVAADLISTGVSTPFSLISGRLHQFFCDVSGYHGGMIMQECVKFRFAQLLIPAGISLIRDRPGQAGKRKGAVR